MVKHQRPPEPIDIRNAVSGDQTAIKFVIEYVGLLAKEITRSVRLGEELASDVVTKLLEHNLLERYDPSQGRPATYLSRITRTTHIDNWRRTKTRSSSSNRDFSSTDYLEGIHTFDPSEYRPEQITLAHRLLQEANDDQRTVLYFIYGEGLSVSETAKVLGLPKGTVKSRHARFLEKARAIVEESLDLLE